VPAFADGACGVVGAEDPHSRVLCFLDWGTLLVLAGGSSVVLVRLGGPRSWSAASRRV
jgi:hypothetical protein